MSCCGSSQNCRPIGMYNPYTPCPAPQLDPPIIFKSAAVETIALTQGTPTAISFPVAVLANPNFSLITSTFTAPSRGPYSFTSSITWSTPYVNTMFTMVLQKNGVNTSFATSTTSGTPGVYVSVIQACMPLELGDVIGVSAQSTLNISIVGSNPCPDPLTFIQGQRVCY